MGGSCGWWKDNICKNTVLSVQSDRMSIVAICKNVKTKLPANKETEIGVRGRDRACRVEAECDRK